MGREFMKVKVGLIEIKRLTRSIDNLSLELLTTMDIIRLTIIFTYMASPVIIWFYEVSEPQRFSLKQV